MFNMVMANTTLTVTLIAVFLLFIICFPIVFEGCSILIGGIIEMWSDFLKKDKDIDNNKG